MSFTRPATQAGSVETLFLGSPGGDPSYDPDCQRTAF
jgi:hypothetical protein